MVLVCMIMGCNRPYTYGNLRQYYQTTEDPNNFMLCHLVNKVP
jgi:hypothetical protein